MVNHNSDAFAIQRLIPLTLKIAGKCENTEKSVM